MFFQGVNLTEIVYDVNTGYHWSASPRAYEIFGKNLTSYDEISTEIDWVSLAVNKAHPLEVFMITNVEWDQSEWIKAKNLASKQIELKEIGKKRESLINSRIIEELKEDETQRKAYFLQELLRQNGMLTKACRESETPMAEYRTWMQSDQDFVQAVEEIKDSILDDVESKLISNAKSGNDFAIKYFMDARGTDRGYGKSAGAKSEESGELDLSLLTYEEQTTLHGLLSKAQPKKPLGIGHK